MMMKTTQLEVLIGYFHEDFDTVHHALELYLADSSAEERSELIPEIVDLLATVTDDSELDEFLERLGSNVYLGEDPAAYRTWLEEIARRVAAA